MHYEVGSKHLLEQEACHCKHFSTACISLCPRKQKLDSHAFRGHCPLAGFTRLLVVLQGTPQERMSPCESLQRSPVEDRDKRAWHERVHDPRRNCCQVCDPGLSGELGLHRSFTRRHSPIIIGKVPFGPRPNICLLGLWATAKISPPPGPFTNYFAQLLISPVTP